jgi:hypothetical protein
MRLKSLCWIFIFAAAAAGTEGRRWFVGARLSRPYREGHMTEWAEAKKIFLKR